MNRKLKRQVERAKTQCRNQRLWHRVVAGLGCAVTFCTTYAMILPAITLEAAEHVLDCPYSVHAHSEGCMDEENNLICGKADYAVHTHDSGCYDEDGALVCLLPEKEAHTHTETCYVTSAVLTCQQEVHIHEDSCYEMPAEGITEPAGEEGQSEGAAPVLICEKPEHSHGEACYEAQRELVCEKDEIILHAHSEECCEEDVLICGKMEVLEHIHGEGCFADVSEETEETEETEAASEAATETSAPSTEPAGTEEPAAETTEPVESGAAVSPNGSQSDVVLTADGDATVVASGTCGTNVTWTLTSDDVLTISGTGAMTRSGWSSYRTRIKTVVIEAGVTSICDGAFQYHGYLTSVKLPNSLTSIGYYAFEQCTDLTSIEIPEGVKYIKNHAFYNCSGLISVKLPNSLTTIGENAFQKCTSLTSIAIPDSVTSLGSGAFANCGLVSVELGDGVKISELTSVFDVSNLESFFVSENNPNYCCVDGVIFNKAMTALLLYPAKKTGSTYTVPAGVTHINTNAFSHCTELTDIILPDSVTAIASEAFQDCTSLVTVNIPDSVTFIGSDAFSGCTNLVSIKIPDSVREIRDYTFVGCTSLTSIDIGAGVHTIGVSVFSGCNNLESIHVDENNKNYTAVDGVLFDKRMTKLLLCPPGKAGEYSVPEGIVTIADSAFSDCKKLTGIEIPDSVTSIGGYAFRGCTALTGIEIPGSVTSIGANTFYNCSGLTSVEIPASVTSIGANTFYNCSGLTSVEIPASVTTIGNSAFSNCTALSDIEIPDSVTSIGSSAFSGCTALTGIEIPNSVTTIGNYAFQNCTALMHAEIPGSVASIAGYMFYGCKALNSVSIADGVSSISSYAFQNCTALNGIEIPNSVTTIGTNAFSGCSNLWELTVQNGTISGAPWGLSKLTHLVIGEDLDTLDSSFLAAVKKGATGLREIRFAGPNHFTWIGEDILIGEITLTAGEYCLDDQGIMYRLYDDQTAELVLVPEELIQGSFEIPRFAPGESEDSENYVVTAIGNRVFKNCTGLTAVTVHDGITRIGYEAFAECVNLASVNGENSLAAVLQTWRFAGVTVSTFRDTLLWENGFDEVVTVTSDVIEAYDDTGRKVTLTLAENTVLTGQTVLSTLTIDQGEKDSHSVVRVYFQFESEHGSINYSLGPSTFDGIQAEVFETAIPNTYCIEIQPLLAGQTLSLNIQSIYKNVVSGDSNALIWLEVLTVEEAEALGNGVPHPETAHMPAWTTVPASFPVTKSAGSGTVTFASDPDNKNMVCPSGIAYTVSMSRSGNVLDYGKDYMTSVDFVDTMTLPEPFVWKEGLADAIRAGQWRCTLTNSGRTATCYVTIGDTEYEIASMAASTGISTNSIKNPFLSVDEAGDPRIGWTYVNSSSTVEIKNFSCTFTVHSPAIAADADVLAQQVAENGKAVTYDFTNYISAIQHYTYGTDQHKEASAVKKVSVGAANYTISKSGYSGSHMGESGTYGAFRITLNNTGALPFTKLDYVTDAVPSYYYIPPADMETMFYQDTFGKDLSVSIKNAALYPAVTETVTGTDGNTYTITRQLQGIDPPYEGKATEDPHVITEKASMTVTWSEDKTHLVLTVAYDGNETICSVGQGQQYASIQEAFDAIGYFVTSKAQYTCTWDRAGQYLYSGEVQTFQIRSAVKDTFMSLSGDQDWYITSSATYASRSRNYAYAYTTDGKYQSHGYEFQIYRDFTLFKDAYLGETLLDETSKIDSGMVLTYRSKVTHSGRAAYSVLPLVDNMEGAQVLLVALEDNPALADLGLETMEISGKTYCLMNREGVYENVQVGNYLADRVEISQSDKGLDTMIYWYLTEVSGSKTLTAEYLALVSPDKSGLVATGNSYQLSNEVWLNDHQTHRLYDQAFLYGTLLSMDKNIVTNIGEAELADLSRHDSTRDELSKRTVIGEGDAVTYRLMLQVTGSGAVTVSGSDIYDELPYSLNSYWSKDNIRISYVPGKDSTVEVTNVDDWHVENQSETQQILRWNEEFSVSIQGTLYIYVTLTFPERDTWADYAHNYADMDLYNTFHAYQLEDVVSHFLSVPTSALLQKNVQRIGSIYGEDRNASKYTVEYRQNTEENALWYYTNDGLTQGVVTYSVTIYNSGDARLYLSEVQDVLPQGFTFLNLYDGNNIQPPSQSGSAYKTNYAYNSLISVDDKAGDPVSYKTAYVGTKVSENGNGQQVLTFSFTNASAGHDLSYDEMLGKYYLHSGEALVFAYNCATNDYRDTLDIAHNTVAMPFYDYNGSGLNLDTQTGVDRMITMGCTSNNGNRTVLTNGQAALAGMSTENTDDSTPWLCSEVDIYRGSIMPGITKSAVKPFANASASVAWNIELTNSGTDSMHDYTVTDVMMAPYQFDGTVAYRLRYDGMEKYISYTDNLFTVESYGEQDDTVTISSPKSSAVLTVNGDYQSLDTSITTARGASSTTYTVGIQVRIGRDAQGNEILSIRFPADTAERLSIPAGGYALMTLQTKNGGTDYENTTYFNTAYLTPSAEQPFDTEAVSQGNYTIYEEMDSVVSEANVAVSYGYATASVKSVAEVNNPENKANSTDSTNYIVLPEAENSFRYSLSVDNTGGDAASKAMDLMVLIDNLPEINDHTTFYSDIYRHSDFKVNFADAEDLDFAVSVNGEVLDGNSYSVEFSRKTEFGDSDWDGTGSDSWYTLDDMSAQGLALADMRSLRVIVRDNTGSVIPAGAEITVSFNAMVDTSSGIPRASKVAWNSFGYHYSLIGDQTELEAAPEKVGVKMPSVPLLVKQLKDSNGNAYSAAEDVSFSFLIYKGEAVSIPDYNSVGEIYSALRGKEFTVVTLKVKAGSSTSETVALEDLYCYEITEAGDLVQTATPWDWQDLARYTLLELPVEADTYDFGAINANQANNFTFSYSVATTRTLTCTNICEVWALQLTKLCQDNNARLPGATFGLYSSNRSDLMDAESLKDLNLDLRNTPENEIVRDGTTWYLMDIRTTDSNGSAEWAGLTAGRYYLLELEAPDGYLMNGEPGQVVSADGNSVARVTVTNAAAYELPETGGTGAAGYSICGTALMVFALVMGCDRKRKQKRSGIA